MKKLAKMIRVLTIAPILALLLINVLYFAKPNSFIGIGNYLFMTFTISLLPPLAYPIQRKFKIFKGDMRKGERNLSIIFSIIGYFAGFLFMLIANTTDIEKIIYLTYLFSGVGIAVFSFLIKVRASGHMCGVAGPIVIILSIFGMEHIYLIMLLGGVIWASLYLKRHTANELIFGSLIPVIAYFLSRLIILI